MHSEYYHHFNLYIKQYVYSITPKNLQQLFFPNATALVSQTSHLPIILAIFVAVAHLPSVLRYDS